MNYCPMDNLSFSEWKDLKKFRDNFWYNYYARHPKVIPKVRIVTEQDEINAELYRLIKEKQ